MLNISIKTSVIKSVLEAGAALVNFRRSAQTDFMVQYKGDSSIVSAADLIANSIIIAGIKELCPDHMIHSEESNLELENISGNSNVWVIDPLDGTRSYVENRDDFSIQVAYFSERMPTFSIMCYPALGRTVVAAKELGCYEISAPEVRLRTSPATVLAPEAVFQDRCPTSSDTDFFTIASIDSGLGFYKVASGELLGGVIKIAGSSYGEWDFAAAALAIRESGGRVSNLYGDQIAFDEPLDSQRHRYVIATNGGVHAELLNRVQAMDRVDAAVS